MRRLLAALMILLPPAYPLSSPLTTTGHGAARRGDQGPAKAAAPDDGPPGAITGRVVDDEGRPVAGAQIVINRVNSKNLLQDFSTDDNGKFKATGLVPGLYAMDVIWPGYVINTGFARSGFLRVGDHLTINLIKGGVITGRVTDAAGEPMALADVSAWRVRDLEGRKVARSSERWRTDDRGIYRLYGLEPGRYVVSVKAGSGLYAGGSETGEETPTYYPSTARDAAAEVTVRAGEEVSGIDIRHRGERGHAISGVVSGDLGPENTLEGVSVKLVNPKSGEVEEMAWVYREPRFAFYGLPDGEYELYAQKLLSRDGNAGSAPRRVILRGADLMGVELRLTRYGSLAGRVMIEAARRRRPSPGCEDRARFGYEEIVLDARSDGPGQLPQDQLFPDGEYWGGWRGGVVDDKGRFTIRNLVSGLYHLDVDLPGEDWYVTSVTRPAAGAPKNKIEVSRAGIAVKSGEKLEGVEVLIAEGAASLRGRAVSDQGDQSGDGTRSSPRLRIYLLPAEEAASGDLLRYAETLAGENGAYEFEHLSPGRYWLLARPVPEAESVEIRNRPVAWDERARAGLRRDAAASNNEIELKPCQRAEGRVLRVNFRRD